MKLSIPKPDELVKDLDRNLAILGLAAGIILYFWLAAGGERTFIESPFMLSFACAIYLIIRKRLSPLRAPFLLELHLKPLAYLILNVSFLAAFSYNVLSPFLTPGTPSRPLGYFISIVFMTAVIALEILSPQRTKAYTGFILLKIMLMALSLRWIPQLLFPDLLGIDPGVHRWFTAGILAAGHVPEGWGYSRMPVFHLIIASTMLITDLSYKLSTMLSICFFEVISLIFVFLLGRFIYNSKVGLLAALLLGIASRNIQWGFWTIPQTLSLCLIPLVVYLVFRANRESVTLASFYLVISAILILTHPVASVCMAILFLLFWISFEFFKQVNRERFTAPASLSLFILFTTAMFSWWMYASGHIQTLANLIGWGFRPEFWSESAITLAYVHEAPYHELLLNRLGFLLFHCFAIVGSLYMLSRRFGNRHSFALVIGGFALIALAFFGPTLGLTGILPQRWGYFSEVIMAIPAAIGLFLVHGAFNNNLGKILALTTLILVISFFSITCPPANMDSPIYSKNTTVRWANTESELKSAETISNMSAGEVWTDHSYGVSGAKGMSQNLITGDFSELDGLIVIRKEILTRPFYARGLIKLNYDPTQKLDSLKFAHVYNSGSVSAFFKSAE